MTTRKEMYTNCLLIESMIKTMVVNGETRNEKLVEAVDELFHPESTEEMEMYSEAIIYAKYSILN